MVTECVPQSETDIHPVHSDSGVVEDLDTWHVTCHEAHHWSLSCCPNYRNKSANSGHQPRPVLLELKSEFGRDSDTNKISEKEILEGCLKYCNHREISNSKLAPIFALCLKISRVACHVPLCISGTGQWPTLSARACWGADSDQPGVIENINEYLHQLWMRE